MSHYQAGLINAPAWTAQGALSVLVPSKAGLSAILDQGSWKVLHSPWGPYCLQHLRDPLAMCDPHPSLGEGVL
jgi:hypothetical protein